ncbi:hypothetical protein [Flavihumibacter profundi]|uniref:hypothetical protein n=1 Tax=Flavihumibacter profundi TaxID=2716883 RepID=UPI001CC7F55E|nr:hypothetical protein [Flavihumibacter profundi]MBZ5859612.1 hypothetical protein [Flavihumibacter profundi]
MEKSNQLFSELLQKIQALLEEYKCKSESRVNDQDAILYGKFSQYMEKYTIVVHVKEEQYKPVTAGARPVEKAEEPSVLRWMPSLDLQVLNASKSNCSEQEQLKIKEQFMADANGIGREFLDKLQRINRQ